jgi:hypothetical protein
MKRYLIFCFVLLFPFCSKAQTAPGQIVINGGVGFSPEFDGDLSINLFSYDQLYPVGTIFSTINAPFPSDDYPPEYTCSSITPNIGGTIDVGIIKWLSLGLAASTQSEVVNWSPAYGWFAIPSGYPYSDKISRTNIAGRLLFHVPWKFKHVDLYGGFRVGESIWHDIPAPYNTNSHTILFPNSNATAYFINEPNESVPSFQYLQGLRVYINDFIGINCEMGIGSPYLVEGGLSIRINTGKSKPETPLAPIQGPKPDDDYGHPVIKQ